MKKKWYVIYTKSNCEKKVAALLTRKKIENYFPINRIANSKGNKNKILLQPLLPSLVFVYASDIEIILIRRINSVINFVYWLGNLAIVKDAEIEHLQHFTNQSFNINVEKTNVNPNGIVKMVKEPKIDLNPNSILISAKSMFKLLVPSLGYILSAEIEQLPAEVFNYSFERSEMLS